MALTFLKSLAFGALALGICVGAATPDGVALVGPDGQAGELTSREAAALPHDAVTLEAHGRRTTYQGLALGTVVARVGAAQGKAIHGTELATVVRVTAADGYQVVLGLAETDPGTRPNRVILADRADGAPLGPEEGPFRLVVEGDLRPARSARNVVRIEVLRLSTARP